MTKKVIIIGATSGIGKSLAKYYAQHEYEVGITGRRSGLLTEIARELPDSKFFAAEMDVAQAQSAIEILNDLVEKMGGVDIIVINAGVGFPKANLEQELQTVDVNARGFLALAHWSYQHFKLKGKGKLVGISSVAAVRSSPYSPEYHATKAFMASYLEGLRLRSKKWKDGVDVIEIRPGYVDTDMTKGQKGMFWVATPEKAAKQIFKAVDANKSVAYITRRYRLIGLLVSILPEWLLAKVL
ncbi:SDR family NAD(P)-dependent oxidoreductase [Lacihabitans sp. LS3-19]|uniref:SDR family NAD(P)-dependent oxidoreductase n=1 Tax=Lacihabitans sp. LS3-19 TaxID=2487335 RepID=UPI0020CF9C1E|nr:SDR family NAD(P)-dependent oxidoreductase [Lacihabitans sp. LS3-19]MCP9767127.1 SDR family NAD(P)-dependent oxidoreductase [Lacihabitans sp. LS3-19]